jgi:hypothetical protein
VSLIFTVSLIFYILCHEFFSVVDFFTTSIYYFLALERVPFAPGRSALFPSSKMLLSIAYSPKLNGGERLPTTIHGHNTFSNEERQREKQND